VVRQRFFSNSSNSSLQEQQSNDRKPGVSRRSSSKVTVAAHDDVPATKAPPPTGQLSIVFTDIVTSTAMWERSPSAMVSAMNLHDSMIRKVTEVNQGYEVKQNGDGFMIAFPTATAAVQFCLDVQEQLLDERWPKEILKLTPGEEMTDDAGHIIFRGFKLRMSAHWGAPVCKWNEVIQRMDYLGPMVNRAARFIEVTEGGQIVVSEDYLVQLQKELELLKTDAGQHQPNHAEEVTPESLNLKTLRSRRGQDKLTHQHFEIRLLGNHEFKGLSDPQKLYFVVPKSLAGRVEHWNQETHIPGAKGNVRSGG
jgi:adenylate cyclase